MEVKLQGISKIDGKKLECFGIAKIVSVSKKLDTFHGLFMIPMIKLLRVCRKHIYLVQFPVIVYFLIRF